MKTYLAAALALACAGLTLSLRQDAWLARAAEKPVPASGDVILEKHVRPLLKAHCFECHGEGKKLRGSLDVRLRRTMVEGGDSGPAIVPHQPGKSLLLERVKSQEMPPGKKKLSKDEIALLERWIQGGAKFSAKEPDKLAPGLYITEEERSFWSFQPIRKPAVPKVTHTSSVRNPIDAFLLARLEAKGLAFSAEADKVTLIRRASFDLVGLPPSPREVEEYLKDQRPDAYEQMIERLLASPHYGERWARHWLDVAGYADSEGFTGEDPLRKSAYKYRDYVIRAFNMDKPFDEFIIEQLAGDELVRPPYAKLAGADLDKLIATGFLRMAPDGTASREADVKVASNQVVADTIQIVSTSILGLTMHCAQCHNHRYDPIPQSDYYKLRAVFEPALDWKNWRLPAAREVLVLSEADKKKADDIEAQAAVIDQERLKKEAVYIEATFQKQLEKVPQDQHELARTAHKTLPAKRTPAMVKLFRQYPNLNVTSGSLYLYDSKAAAELKGYAAKAVALRAKKPAGESIRALTEIPGKVPATFVFERGEFEQPSEEVAPAHLMVLESFNLGKIPAKDPALPTTGRRLAFAKSLVSGTHPLTARVLVNRVWLNHFGRGIVNTPSDFGHLGELPTHPELLDWLASEFMRPTHQAATVAARPWSLKGLHRLIMTSTAYRQASARTPALQKVDPDNLLLGRFSMRRLEAEMLRDTVLAVSGKLNAKQFGAPVPIMFDDLGQVVVGVDTTDTAGRPSGKIIPLNGEEYRRSIYVQVRRSRPLSMLETFDAPLLSPNCEIRTASTQAPQSLLLMNSRFIHEYAGYFAQRVLKEAGADLHSQIKYAWRVAFSREPADRDISEAAAFINQQTSLFQTQKATNPPLQGLTSFCQALLSANEFLYVD